MLPALNLQSSLLFVKQILYQNCLEAVVEEFQGKEFQGKCVVDVICK